MSWLLLPTKTDAISLQRQTPGLKPTSGIDECVAL